MKNLVSHKFIGALIIFTALSLSAFAGPFYVVVGSFSKERSAREFATSIRNKFAEAAFKLELSKNLYHVYVMETGHFNEADNFRESLKKQNGFAHAWIFTDFESGASLTNAEDSDNPIRLELYTGNTVFLGSTDNGILTISKGKGQSSEAPGSAIDTPFTFVAITVTGQSVPGKVVLVRNGNEISAFKTGEVVSISGKPQTLSLICQVDGYSPELKMIHPEQLGSIRDVYQNDDGVWEARFWVTRMKVDQVPLRFHDIFYPDAAVMKPSSKQTVDLLVSMAKSNPASKIVVNAHCNPRTTRDIVVPGNQENYFDLDAGIEKSGSEKQLTRERAQILKDYLVAHGIAASRIAIMGWGSLDLLVKGAEADVEINERVDIELSIN